jgi:hypothetical protein
MTKKYLMVFIKLLNRDFLVSLCFRSSAWIERRPSKAKVAGSNPAGSVDSHLQTGSLKDDSSSRKSTGSVFII